MHAFMTLKWLFQFGVCKFNRFMCILECLPLHNSPSCFYTTVHHAVSLKKCLHADSGTNFLLWLCRCLSSVRQKGSAASYPDISTRYRITSSRHSLYPIRNFSWQQGRSMLDIAEGKEEKQNENTLSQRVFCEAFRCMHLI